jgi:hypothetical protein
MQYTKCTKLQRKICAILPLDKSATLPAKCAVSVALKALKKELSALFIFAISLDHFYR